MFCGLCSVQFLLAEKRAVSWLAAVWRMAVSDFLSFFLFGGMRIFV
jgi:hypothetical protein